MTPRPLHKWKSFWFGILVLGFLGSVWVKARAGNWSGWISSPALSCGAAQHQGEFGVFVNIRPPTGWEVGSEDGPRQSEAAWFSAPGDVEWSGKEGFEGNLYHSPHLYLCVAYWFLILLFLVPWVGFLAWRVRRQRKQTGTNA
jgi:hypothetical protein